MKIIDGKLKGSKLIIPISHGDNRGFFMESYNHKNMVENNIDFNFIQDNHSLSTEAGVIRGLHYQLNPKAQTKLIRVVAGAIYDVIVDIRKGSETFGMWQGFILSDSNKHQLLVPAGFAHGFCTLVPHTQVMYKVDEYYSPEFDRGILWNDEDLAINWPTFSPILSDKDKSHPKLKEADLNFE